MEQLRDRISRRNGSTGAFAEDCEAPPATLLNAADALPGTLKASENKARRERGGKAASVTRVTVANMMLGEPRVTKLFATHTNLLNESER